jgi:hypothetical protein
MIGGYLFNLVKKNINTTPHRNKEFEAELVLLHKGNRVSYGRDTVLKN